mmetsp:Transcript_6127/g.38044  ORF Transcript_6127/g.38044 Transcript_6127/m.38044 type:complete len:219 (+) Transcript_6127:2152-2808(+)
MASEAQEVWAVRLLVSILPTQEAGLFLLLFGAVFGQVSRSSASKASQRRIFWWIEVPRCSKQFPHLLVCTFVFFHFAFGLPGVGRALCHGLFSFPFLIGFGRVQFGCVDSDFSFFFFVFLFILVGAGRGRSIHVLLSFFPGVKAAKRALRHPFHEFSTSFPSLVHSCFPTSPHSIVKFFRIVVCLVSSLFLRHPSFHFVSATTHHAHGQFVHVLPRES